MEKLELNSGRKQWKDVTRDDLFELTYNQKLPDCSIARMFNVKKSAVTYKRHKFDIVKNQKSYGFMRQFKNLVLKQAKECGLTEKEAIETLEDFKKRGMYKDYEEM